MLPKKIQKNQLITADLLNNIIDSIRECQINSGVGYSFSRNAGGTTLSISSGKQKSIPVADVCPFDVTTTVTGSDIRISVEAGLVNGVLPINIFNTITANLAGKKYVVLNCETDGKNVVSASWSVENNFPVPPESSPDTAPITFGILISAISGSQVFKTIPCQNIMARITPSIQSDVDTYVAGKRNFVQYYNWVF